MRAPPDAKKELDKVRRALARKPLPPEPLIPQAPGAASTLIWSDITINETVFQRRGFAMGYARPALIDTVARSLKRGGSTDPITVWWAGKWMLVDGHHRMEAYRVAFGRSTAVSVAVLHGSLEEALAASVSLNFKHKLPMTKREATDSAWFLAVHAPDMSRARVVEATGTSEGTVSAQRRVRDQLRAQRTAEGWPEENCMPTDLDWEAARAAAAGHTVVQRDGEAIEDAMVAKMMRGLAAQHGRDIATNPGLFLTALARLTEDISGGITAEAVLDAFGLEMPEAEPAAAPTEPTVDPSAHLSWAERAKANQRQKAQEEEAQKVKVTQTTRAGLMQEARRQAEDPVAAAVLLRLALDPRLGQLGNTMAPVVTPEEAGRALMAGPWGLLEGMLG